MGAEHDFSWRVELVAFKKEGLAHMGKFMDNLLSRGKELPGNAYFRTPLDIRVNPRTGKREIFWKGYDRSISESMRRNAALLRLRGVPKDKIDQAKAGWQMWNQLQNTILNLEPDQAVQFLALRGLNPEDGMALQQISWQDGQLVLESQLLPSGELRQTENLVALVGKDREMIEMNMERAEGLSPLMTWAIQGKAIDFGQDLPGMIQESLSVNQEIGMPMHVMEGVGGGAGLGIEISDVHSGSVHELEEAEKIVVPTMTRTDLVSEVREVPERPEMIITELPEYGAVSVSQDKVGDVHSGSVYESAPSAVATVQPHFGSGVVVEPVVESVVMGAMAGATAVVTETETPVYEEISLSQSEPQVTRGQEMLMPVSQVAIVVPMVTGTDLVSEVMEVPERPEMTITELPRYEEIKVVGPQVIAPVQQESVKVAEEMEEVITENTPLRPAKRDFEGQARLPKTGTVGQALATVGQAEITEGTEGEMAFSAFGDYVSVPLVIKETFNEPVEYQEHKSVKAKIVWLGRSWANVVADGLMGRWWKPKQDKPILAWLVYGMALIQFDSVDKSQFDGGVSGQMSQWRLSPVRVWADRVAGRARRVKDKIVQTGWGVYKQLFANI